MIDLIANAIGSMFASSGAPRTAGAKRTPGQELLWGLAIMGFPILDFLAVFQLGAALALPLPFLLGAATLALARRVGADRGLTFLATLCGFLFCLAASFFGALMGAGGFFGF